MSRIKAIRRRQVKMEESRKVYINSLFDWWMIARKKGIKLIVQHPHHYVVAFALSMMMIYMGGHGYAEHVSAWMYAVLENISTVDMD